MFRGEIRLVDFEPSVGREANKRRPAVIVSNDNANEAAAANSGLVVVLPMTSNVTRVRTFQTLLPASRTGLARDSKTQTEQVRAVSVERVGSAIGAVPIDLLDDIDDALRLHLDL